jgi:hypothetical protein
VHLLTAEQEPAVDGAVSAASGLPVAVAGDGGSAGYLGVVGAGAVQESGPSLAQRVAALESEVATLRDQLAQLRAD